VPELGKATYWLVLNTEEYNQGWKQAQATATTATDAIDKQLTGTEEQLQLFGTTAMETGGKVSAAADEMAGSMEGAAAKVDESTAAMSGGMKRAGAASTLAAGESAAAWRKSTASLAAAGKQSMKMAGMAGLGLAYFVIKEGVKTLKANNLAQLQLNNAVKQSGDIQNINIPTISRLADTWMKVDGQQRAVTLSIAGMLTNFQLIRNEAGKGNDVFDRSVNVIGEISAKMQSLGKNIKTPMLSMMIGRMLTDPAKGMAAAGRAGIKFSETQMAVVKHLIAANKGFEAQKYILGILEKTYKGAGKTLGDSFTGQWNKIKTQFGEASAKLMTTALPFFKILVGWLVKGATWLSKHVQLVKALIIGFGVLYGVIKTLEIAAAIFEMILSPEELIVAGIAALVAVFVLAVKYPKLLEQGLEAVGVKASTAKKIVMDLRKAFAWVRMEALKLWPTIKKAFEAIVSAVEAAIGLIRKHWDEIMKFIKIYVDWLVNSIKNDLQIVIGIFHFVGDILRGNWGNLVHDLGQIFWGLVDQLKNVGNTMIKLFEAVGSAIWNTMKSTAQAVANAFISALNWVSDMISKIPIPTIRIHHILGIPVPEPGITHLKMGHIGQVHWAGPSGHVTTHQSVPHGIGAGHRGGGAAGLHGGKKDTTKIPGSRFGGGGIGGVNAGIGNLKTGSMTKAKKKKGAKLGAGGILGPEWAILSMGLDKAELTKGLADDKRALDAEERFLKRVLDNHKNSLKMRMAAAKALAEVNKKLTSLQAQVVKNENQTFNDRMAIELAKASLLGGAAGAAKTAAVQAQIRKHELAMYTAEEDALKKRLKDKTLTLHQQAELWKQIASIDKKRIALAKQANADAAASAKELQAVMELRGSFFSEFAGNIFGESAGGGLSLSVNQPGNAPSKTVKINQNNVHHEIPKNRHYHADQARRLSQGAFAGM